MLRDTRITGILALALSPLPALMEIVRLFPFGWASAIGNDVTLALWALEFGLIVAYIIPRVEYIVESLAASHLRPAQGIEVFRHADELLIRIADLTIGAEDVATLNLSPAPETSPALTRYFERVNAHLAKRRSPLLTFRSIGSQDNQAKIVALIDRATRLQGRSPVSLGAFPREIRDDGFSPLGIHLVKRHEGYSSFIFPRVLRSGEMHGILIHGQATYDILVEYFNGVWNNRELVTRILEGGHLNAVAIEQLRASTSASP